MIKKDKINFLVKVQNPLTKYEITIRNDGMVFGNDKGFLVIKLKRNIMKIIRGLIAEDISLIKSYGYHVHNTDGFIVRLWDDSRVHRNIKVKGWKHAEEIIELVFDEDNIKQSFVGKCELDLTLEQLYACSFDLVSDKEVDYES